MWKNYITRLAYTMWYVRKIKDFFFFNWNQIFFRPITDDPIIKLTVYDHTKPKNPLSLSEGEFIGRAYVSLRDLQDYDRIHTK
jgi:hypothetical protein